MKSRIAVTVFSVLIAVLSLAAGGCSNGGQPSDVSDGSAGGQP